MKPTWRPSRTACSAATAAGFVPGFSTTMYPCEETPSAPATGTTAIAHSTRTTMARRFMLSLLLISNPRLTEQLSTDLSSPRGTMPREVWDSNQANHRIDVGETPGARPTTHRLRAVDEVQIAGALMTRERWPWQ